MVTEFNVTRSVQSNNWVIGYRWTGHWFRFIVSPPKLDGDKRQFKPYVPIRAVVIELGIHFALDELDFIMVAMPEQVSV
tara:strand:+ start:8376 stop:8612 length:237 start_codon:yes stop_codon:yes gene_type:complete